jgi:MFS-type transporter involved in bile tolerance (Atg22 family)
MELLSAYPELVAGTVAGYLFARFGWRATPLIAVGAVALAAATLYQSTVPHPSATTWRHEASTAPAQLWALIAAVNAASWALGIGIGVAVESTSRRHRIAPAPRR